MSESKPDVDPVTHMTRDEAWAAAREWAEAQRRPTGKSPVQSGSPAPIAQKKK